MYFFTADEHYNHKNIIKYCNRPFIDVGEMNREIIERHNSKVKKGDIVIHAGDFCMSNHIKDAMQIRNQLNGKHIFLRGSHDAWMNKGNGRLYFHEIWEKKIQGQYVVVCHYALRTWPRSHYNSWCCYGHSHGKLEPIGKSWDVGVDNNNFYPVSFEELKKIMESRPDNPNLIRG